MASGSRRGTSSTASPITRRCGSSPTWPNPTSGRSAVGSAAKVTVRADLGAPVEGKVTFIYPELKPETRTVPVRIEIPNPEGQLKTSMYADVVLNAGDGSAGDRRSPPTR